MYKLLLLISLAKTFKINYHVSILRSHVPDRQPYMSILVQSFPTDSCGRKRTYCARNGIVTLFSAISEPVDKPGKAPKNSLAEH